MPAQLGLTIFNLILYIGTVSVTFFSVLHFFNLDKLFFCEDAPVLNLGLDSQAGV